VQRNFSQAMTNGIAINAKSTEISTRSLNSSRLQKFLLSRSRDSNPRKLPAIQASQASSVWHMPKYASKKKLKNL